MNKTNFKSIRTFESFYFYQKINYIYNNKHGSILSSENEDIQIKERSNYIINNILERYLTTLNTYNKLASKILNTKYNNPIVLSKNLIFIKTSNIKSYENIWINFANIKSFKQINNELMIEFYDGQNLKIKKGVSYLKKQSDKINTMKTYLLRIRLE